MSKVPEAVQQMGIRANISNVFHFKSYFVLKIEICDIDRRVLLTNTKGAEFSEKFDTLVDCFQHLGIESGLRAVDTAIGEKVFHGLMAKLQEVIPEKLQEVGFRTTCNVASREDQADLSYEILNNF